MRKLFLEWVKNNAWSSILTLIIISLFSNLVLAQTTKTITGTVTDPYDQPLIGVTIAVVDHISGTTTDLEGRYSLEIPESATQLKFSYVGYESQTVDIGVMTTIDIVMEVDAIGLDEIVVVGYGTMRKQDLTGSISQVNAEKLASESTSNMMDMLRGSTPGLNVSFRGSPTGIRSASSLEVRGSTNVRGASANAPLVVLDGMIYSGDLADINPADISSFDILKDASSAAIYGSRASNGVILITTKRSKTGKPRINVSTSIGMTRLSGAEFDPMDGPEFIDWRIAGFESNERRHLDFPGYYNNPNDLPSGVNVNDWKGYDGSSQSDDLVGIWLNRIGFSPVEIQNYKDGNTVNWKDVVYQTGLRQDYNVSVSGQNDRLSYYWSLGYTDNEGVIYNERFTTL